MTVFCLSTFLSTQVLSTQESFANSFSKPYIFHYLDYQYRAHNQNWCAKRAMSGLLFFCNGEGILQYDGANWHLIKSVLFTGIQAMSLDEGRGRIYTGSENHLGYFDVNNQTQAWKFTEIKPLGRPNFNRIVRVERGVEGTYFLSDEWLYYLNDADNKLSWYAIEAGRTYHLAIIEQKVLVFDYKNGVRQLNLASSKFEPVNGSEKLEQKYIMFDVNLGNGQFLLGSAAKGLYLYNGKSVQPFAPDLLSKHGFLLKGLLLPDNNIALATRSNGLFIVSQQGEIIKHYSKATGLESNLVIDLTYDEQGSVWLAYSGGLSQIIQPLAIQVFSRDDGFSNIEVILPTKNGVFVGRESQLLRLIKSQNAVYDKQIIAEDIEVKDLDETDSGLIVSTNRAIKYFAWNLQSTETPEIVDLLTSTVPGYSQALVSKRHPNVIYASLGKKLYRLHLGAIKSRLDPKVYTMDEVIATITELPSGNLWLGSESQSIVHLSNTVDWNNLEIKSFGEKDNVPPGLVTPFLRGNETVFGSRNGFLTFNATNQNFSAQPRYLKASNNEFEIFRLAQDKDQIVFRHSEGLGRVSFQQHHTQFESQYLHFLGNSSTYSLVLDDEILWVGTTRGLFRVDQSLLFEVNSAPTLIKSIDSDTVTLFQAHLLSSQVLPRLNLKQQQRELKITTTFANYLPNSNSSYKMSVNGKSANWTENTEHLLSLSNDSEHQVLFQHRIKDRDALSQTSLAVKAQAFWYETRIYQITLMLLLVSLIIFTLRRYARFKLQRVEKEKQELEGIVKQRTATIKVQSEKLISLERSRNKLLSNVSHEFRTPLSLILSPLELVINQTSLSHNYRSHLETARTNANRMLNLVNQILDINRIENSTLPLKRELHDVSLFIEQLLDNFNALAEQEQKTLERSGIEAKIFWEFDPYYLERIIFNLIANAFKFTHKGGIITTTLHLSGDELVIAIKDNGVGMSSEAREHVFERFFQENNKASEFKPGTGIGLSLVHELVSLHSGKIECRSTLGEGSEFLLNFSYKKPKVALISSAENLNTELTVDMNISTTVSTKEEVDRDFAHDDDRKIMLVVEDNDELRKFISILFEDEFDIYNATDGEQGLSLARKFIPDIIISDVMMPVMDGFELIDALGQDPSVDYIPTILLTAKTNKIDTVKGLTKGADDYISKPFHNEELKARVKAILRTREKLKERLRQQLQTENKIGEAFEDDYLALFKNRLNIELNSSHEDFDLFISAVDLVRQHLAEDYLNVAYLSDKLNMDRSTLFRKLKPVITLSPNQLIREIRLLESSILLEKKQGSISEIAYAVGFNCVSYFTKCFRARFSITPSEYAAK